MALAQPVKAVPKEWPRLSTAISYDDAARAIDWLCDAFGFHVRIKVVGEGGKIVHSELEWGEALIMAAQSGGRADRPLHPPGASPKSVGGANTQCVMLFVDDADAHCAHARAHGAKIVDEPADHDYGAEYWTDRSYGAVDLEGHMWWFTQRLRDPAPK